MSVRPTSRSTADRFVRDRFTLSLYAPFIAWGWFLYAFSPAVPLIAVEQGISRGVAGLHGTGMALGSVVTGLTSHAMTRRIGRRGQAVVGAGLTALGVALLLTVPVTVVTVLACVVAGAGGTYLVTAAQPALLQHQKRFGTAAVTEGNALGAAVGLLAPLALGAFVAAGLGWRPAVSIEIVLAVAVAMLVLRLPRGGALGHGESVAVPVASATAVRVRFPRAFWLYWTAMVSGVAVEFATTFWASDLVIQQTDAPASVAAASVSALVLGMATARFVVGPLSTHRSPGGLLLVGFAVAGLGWILLWTATSPVVAVLGLVVTGLGFGTHYPLAVALALGGSGGRPDAGQGLLTLGSGVAVGLAPFLLGGAADLVGPHQAFLLVPAILAVGGTAVAIAIKDDAKPTALRRALRLP
ncbi:sugar MFS transporter [Actinotalea sp.]|uniref:MFS transporter n=1 Tax=Actinotalea sp. TaxID=1872145 RepID=UPI00356B4566